MSGTKQLREQLAALQSSLQAFDAPIVDDYPGLRLMAETLREREQHIRQQIEKNETCTVSVLLRNAAQAGAVPAGLVAKLITGVGTAVRAAADAAIAAWEHPPPAAAVDQAVTVHLRDLDTDGDVSLTLARPPGELAAQLVHLTSGAPLAEYVMARVTEALAAAVDGEDVPGELADPLRSLADVVITSGTVLEWDLEPYVLDPRAVVVDQAAAQRMLRHGTA